MERSEISSVIDFAFRQVESWTDHQAQFKGRQLIHSLETFMLKKLDRQVDEMVEAAEREVREKEIEECYKRR